MSDPQPPPVPAQHEYEYVPNHLVWAILSTLFCCLPLGIVAIVHAAKVDEKRAAGDLPGAREASHKAKFWALLSFAIAVIPVILYLLFTLLLGGIGILGGLSGAH
ncbi:MAG TPA: CD225/dispanin family protein [Pseudoxanthomonas sp.]|nr:CD225/dispanin family protein [Pseudoxanthomonas sp.]